MVGVVRHYRCSVDIGMLFLHGRLSLEQQQGWYHISVAMASTC
jgi:hypothetical protein